MPRFRGLLLGLAFALPFATSQAFPQTFASLPTVAGRTFGYSVRSGDSLSLIGARFGVESSVLASRNGLSRTAHLAAGQVLEIDNRHIVPASMEDGILINIPQRLLFYFEQGELILWYPVGLGRPDWQTPTGSFYVLTKETDPVWDVPSSIQEEMRREGKRVRTKVPPGPANPLGQYWLGLSGSFCGIHGTNAPASIYRFQTHGCMRLHPDDIADLFSRVTIGTPVEIIYESVLLARDEDGTVFLEVHPDVYRRKGDPNRNAEALAEKLGLPQAVQWPLWKATIRSREGTAQAVARMPAPD